LKKVSGLAFEDGFVVVVVIGTREALVETVLPGCGRIHEFVIGSKSFSVDGTGLQAVQVYPIGQLQRFAE
jgi:hypothetical protein